MTSSFPVRAALMGLAGVLILAACSGKPVPPCPPVRVDSNTARYVKFQKDATRDLTQVAYSVELSGFEGQCTVKKDHVDVVMDLTFDITAGPAVEGRAVEIPYFVALPQFFPKPFGKRVMTVTAKMPAKSGLRERVQEKGVRVSIPLAKDEPAAAYDVYVGLQIADADADYNRERRARELESARQAK